VEKVYNETTYFEIGWAERKINHIQWAAVLGSFSLIQKKHATAKIAIREFLPNRTTRDMKKESKLNLAKKKL
jgi:hypothetical protein